MKLSEFNKLVEGLPDDTDMVIFNASYEWYGSDFMNIKAWEIIDGKLVYSFCNDAMDKYDRDDYKEPTI